MASIERANPHDFGAESILTLAVELRPVGSLSQGQVLDIKALDEGVKETGVDLVVSFGNAEYYAKRQGGSRSQPVHWALMYYRAPDGTNTQRR